ncbi:MAG TPA: glycosyltransferase family 2 protein, partial [Actinoplanes sp.]
AVLLAATESTDFTVNRRLPAFRTGLFGRGVIVLGAAARARFDRFPDMVSDDLFLDSLFTVEEKREVSRVPARVATPLRTGALIRRLVRVRAGNAAMRTASARGEVGATVRAADRSSWLRDVLLRRPWLAPAAACYVGITLYAAVRARGAAGQGWGRDDSTRQEEAHV